MGGNKENKRTTSLTDQERERQQREHTTFMNMAEPRRNQEQTWADTTRGDILGGYRKLYENATGGTDMFGGGGGGGGYAAQTYNPVLANLERARLSGYVGESADVARTLGKGGEWDPRIREGYGNFAETGGYSADDISNIRNRAASSSPAFYESVRNRMAQKARASGLNTGGLFDVASDRLTRESARGAAENSLNAELGLADAIRQGKLQGLSGLTGLDTSMNQFRGTGMQGLLGAGEAENAVNMFNAGQGNQMSMFNTGILNEAGMFNTSAANAAAASSASAAERNRADKVREYMMGLSGMQDIYGSTPAELARQEELMMRGRFGHAGNVGDLLSLRSQNNPRGPSAIDRIMQAGGIAGGLAGAWLGR